MEIKIDNALIDIEKLDVQKYKNISIIPIMSESSQNIDILSLKKGLDLGLVKVEECKKSVVGKVRVSNNAVTPLILVDGDEIIGAKQNRIINTTVLIPPKTTMDVSVSCSEYGRWYYKDKYSSKFTYSKYFANSDTRRVKSYNLFEEECQSVIWDSIRDFESRHTFKSETSALNDNYENLAKIQEEYLKHFGILDNQNGVIVIIGGELKGIEIFNSHLTYKEYHDKIIRSYIVDSINFESPRNMINYDEIDKILGNISNSNFKEYENKELGKSIKFSNNYGVGVALIYEGNIIHMLYFKNPEKYAFLDNNLDDVEVNIFSEKDSEIYL